jgi:hypothetical protein
LTCPRPRGRSHEFWTDRVFNRLAKNPVDLSVIIAGQFPTECLLHAFELPGISGAPKRHGGFSSIKNPTDRECQKALPMILQGMLTQSIGCFQVLAKARLLKLRIFKSKIVTL